MKKFMLMIAGLGVAASALPATAFAAPAPRYGYAQGWMSIRDREANLNARIDQGIRSGALSRREADSVRRQFTDLTRLEARYRASRPGLTMAERHDLDRRFDALSAKIRFEKHDRNGHRF